MIDFLRKNTIVSANMWAFGHSLIDLFEEYNFLSEQEISVLRKIINQSDIFSILTESKLSTNDCAYLRNELYDKYIQHEEKVRAILRQEELEEGKKEFLETLYGKKNVFPQGSESIIARVENGISRQRKYVFLFWIFNQLFEEMIKYVERNGRGFFGFDKYSRKLDKPDNEQLSVINPSVSRNSNTLFLPLYPDRKENDSFCCFDNTQHLIYRYTSYNGKNTGSHLIMFWGDDYTFSLMYNADILDRIELDYYNGELIKTKECEMVLFDEGEYTLGIWNYEFNESRIVNSSDDTLYFRSIYLVPDGMRYVRNEREYVQSNTNNIVVERKMIIPGIKVHMNREIDPFSEEESLDYDKVSFRWRAPFLIVKN